MFKNTFLLTVCVGFWLFFYGTKLSNLKKSKFETG